MTASSSQLDTSATQEDEEAALTISEPTHFSKLDLKKLRVDEIRVELTARNIDIKGLKLKQQLLVRLKEAIESEKVSC